MVSLEDAQEYTCNGVAAVEFMRELALGGGWDDELASEIWGAGQLATLVRTKELSLPVFVICAFPSSYVLFFVLVSKMQRCHLKTCCLKDFIENPLGTPNVVLFI